MSVLRRTQVGLNAVANDLPLRSDVRNNSYHLQEAIHWLCRSQDATANGGSAATYNIILGWEDAYPETTGYIIPTLLEYAGTVDKPRIADRAIRMADWLCSIQQSAGSFPAGTGTDGEPNVFNTGQIVLGLTEAYRETGNERYLTAVREACDWLVSQQGREGYWDKYDYKNQVHAYSTRVAWALVEGAAIIPAQTDELRDAARRNFEWALGLQRSNGWFDKAAFEPDQTPYLHTIAYTIRGLLEGGLKLDNENFVDAATRAADKLVSIQQKDGILRGAYDSSWSPSWYYCLTGNAQMAIIWLRLFELTGEQDYRTASREMIEFLKRRQLLVGPEEVRGGIPGSYPIIGKYLYLRFPNWGMKFFADSLLLTQKLKPLDSPLDVA
ncbi:prenyltransferase/squalene oxidase repeat-containing protein [Halovenus sp. HT40]|uniref:prenyltransferase/squalene oxidase repeat-containing protein n=1 Tax=Halovenus sp. HT40 TaxID=3126691 RepID=UPI00300EC887